MTTVGTILAGLSRTEALVAINGRDRLVRVDLVPGLRVGDHVLVREARVVARITSTEAAAIDSALDGNRRPLADPPVADG